MTISNFEIGKCYSTFSLSQNRMAVMKGDDFNYKLVVYNDGTICSIAYCNDSWP